MHMRSRVAVSLLAGLSCWLTFGTAIGQTICTDTCAYAGDGECDDGGPGSLYGICDYGTDCRDCGVRGPQGVTSAPLCTETCSYAGDGECDDGGPGSVYALCTYGSDCRDCGPRTPQVDNSGGGGCSDTCQYANDGECDDGGPGSLYNVCPYGSDCGDCGPRSAAVVDNSVPGCGNTCQFANDGECDDGGPGSLYSVCEYGSDCGDCGPRTDQPVVDPIVVDPIVVDPIVVVPNTGPLSAEYFTDVAAAALPAPVRSALSNACTSEAAGACGTQIEALQADLNSDGVADYVILDMEHFSAFIFGPGRIGMRSIGWVAGGVGTPSISILATDTAGYSDLQFRGIDAGCVTYITLRFDGARYQAVASGESGCN